MEFEERAAFLRRVIDIARTIKRDAIVKGGLTKDDLEVTGNCDTTIDLPPLNIEDVLLELGLSSEAMELLSPLISSVNAAYRRAFQRLSTSRRFPGMPSVPEVMEKIAGYVRETYRKEVLPVLKERILSFLHARDENRFTIVDQTEPSFNSQYTPFLLQYFEFNAYPSLADRELLAKKSGMTPRQIEVWFQNRRRRLKSTGRNYFPRRGARDALPEQNMYGFVEKMSAFKSLVPLPEPPIAVDKERYASVTFPKHQKDLHAKDVFERPVPAHAFPCKISEKAVHPDLFPRKGEHGPRFPSPPWYRKPASQRPQRQQVDFDDLLTQFNLLRAGEYKMSKEEEEKHVIPGAPPAATFAFTIVPESAPLKAKVPEGVVPPAGIPLLRREESPTPEQPKKKARLPHRTPSSKPARSHPYPRTPSLSPTSSRTSSATLSSGSSSRSSSTGPHTPPPITALALPGLEDFTFVRSSSPDAVSSGFDDLFGDEPSSDLPQQDLSFESLLDGITFPTLSLPPSERDLTLLEQESSSTELDHLLNSWTNDSLLNQPTEQTLSDPLLDFNFDFLSSVPIDWNVDFPAFVPDTQTQVPETLTIPEFSEADLQALANVIEPPEPTGVSPSSLTIPTALPPPDISVLAVSNATFDVSTPLSTPQKSTTYTDLTGRKQMLFDLLGNVTVPFGLRVGF